MTNEVNIFPEKTPIDQRWNAVLALLPAIGKDSVNQQQGFKYRSIDTVLDHLNPLFARCGVHVMPVRQVAERDQRATRSGGTLNVCYITVTWQIRSVDSEVIECETLGEGTDSGDKSTSKAQTMALKYLLWPSLVIAENEDPDGTTVEESAPRQGRGKAPQPEYEWVNGEQIPLSPKMETTYTGPGGVDATRLNDAQQKKAYALVKGNWGQDANVNAVLSELFGREVRHTRELGVHELDRLVQAAAERS